MSLLTAPPSTQLPTVDTDGAVMQYAGRFAKNAVLSVFEMKGGARGLYEWSNKSAQNESDFYTKLFAKTIQKDVEVNDRRSIEDVLAAIDGDFTVVENPVPAAGPAAQFASFAPSIVLGVDEEDEVRHE